MSDAPTYGDFAPQIRDEDFRRLFDDWNEQRGKRFAPARRDIDPLTHRALVGDMLLIDVLMSPLRFRFRLHGTRLAERAGYDMTGRPADEMPIDDNRDVLLARFFSLVENRRPEYGNHDRIVTDRRWRYEVLWLPLSDDGETVDMLLGALRYRDTIETSRSLDDFLFASVSPANDA